jgi:WD40 repeat protein
MRMELSPDGSRLALHHDSGRATLWDLDTREQLAVVEADSVTDLAWSADSSRLAVARVDPDGFAVVVLDRDGTRAGVLEVEDDVVILYVGLSPDGTLVSLPMGAGPRQDPSRMDVEIWDWAEGRLVTTVDSETPIEAARFDPTGRQLITIGWLQGVVEIWDLDSGDRVATLTAPPITTDAVVSGDGSTIATAHRDGTVRVWDAGSGVQRLVLHGHDRVVADVELSADASVLLSLDDFGFARAWALDLDDLAEIASGRLTRGFSDEECRLYLHLDACPDEG